MKDKKDVAKVVDLNRCKREVLTLCFSNQQWNLFRHSEPGGDVELAAEYWEVVGRVLAYGQGMIGSKNSRALSDRLSKPLTEGEPAPAVVDLVAAHLAMTFQRRAWPKRDGTLTWETAEQWVVQVLDALNAEGCLVYWHETDVETLIDALYDRADMARFVGAIRAGTPSWPSGF